MKMKTKKLLELLKSGLVLFGISLVLWNCTSNDTITIEEKLQVFEPIEASEAQSIISNIIEEQKLRRAKTSPIKIDHSSLNFIEVNNTNISIPTFSATWNEKIKTKAFLVKKNGVAYPCLYHLVPFKDEKLTNNLFSGGIIITTIENEFINGYKVEEGIINAKYIRKDSSSSESGRKADDSEFNCSGAAWCDSLNEVNIYSSNGGGSSSGSGSINIITSNPVSSQGWMISLSGDNVSGGAVGGSSSSYSNSGDGGESSGNLLSLFNCDNPTPKGCENDEEEEEENIINNLEGRTKCAYERLLSTGVSSFHNMITDLFIEFGNNNIGGRDLTFMMSSDLPENVAGKTEIDSYGDYRILINQNLNTKYSSIEIAGIIVHEIAHAFLAKHYNNSNSSFYDLYQEYINDTGIQNYSHDIMKDQFINRMATVLKNYNNSIFSNFNDYKILASYGVFNLSDSEKEHLINVKNKARTNDTRCN